MMKSEDVHRGGGFIDVRDQHDGSLLFRYDPVRQVVEIRKKKVLYQVGLTEISCPQP